MTPPRQGTGREQIHRALSSPVRRRIVELLDSHDQPLDVHELAERLRLHVNTTRTHLTVLERAGLVASAPEKRDRPGRPRLLYRTTEGTSGGDEGGYRFLSLVLAGHLASSVDDPATSAEQAGRAWGRFLVDAPAPFSPMEPHAGIARVLELLDTYGFAPELDETTPAPRILLRRCPFREVARDHQEVVCSIHRGLMRGALEELGVDVEVTDLIPFVDPDLCVSHLRVPA